MPKKPQRKDESSPASSEEVLLATIQPKYVWAVTWRLVLSILALGVLLLMATPLARAIAGTNTSFNVTINIVATATFALTTVAGWRYGVSQRKRANHLEVRNKALNERVEELQKDLEALRIDKGSV